jgi:hypothetical protein
MTEVNFGNSCLSFVPGKLAPAELVSWKGGPGRESVSVLSSFRPILSFSSVRYSHIRPEASCVTTARVCPLSEIPVLVEYAG